MRLKRLFEVLLARWRQGAMKRTTQRRRNVRKRSATKHAIQHIAQERRRASAMAYPSLSWPALLHLQLTRAEPITASARTVSSGDHFNEGAAGARANQAERHWASSRDPLDGLTVDNASFELLKTGDDLVDFRGTHRNLVQDVLLVLLGGRRRSASDASNRGQGRARCTARRRPTLQDGTRARPRRR
jgi:hypothetical protein